VALRPLVLLPERDWVYARCDRRFAMMWEGGALAEVEALLARRLDPDLPVMRAIGVPEIAAFLAGTLDADSAMSSGQQATRRYVKRQFTWLRHQIPVDWPRFTNENYLDTPHIAALFQN
jgi:tRNA dimethylallyltransferase